MHSSINKEFKTEVSGRLIIVTDLMNAHFLSLLYGYKVSGNHGAIE